MTTTTTLAGDEVLARFFEAAEAADLERMRALVHEDVTMEWPQSGERFRGVDNAAGALAATEVKPEVAGEPRIAGEGRHWTLRMPLRYGDDVYHYVGVFEIEGGRIARSTEYFGAPFPAQEGRARFAER
jgi:ketosteroid isomerase-like protein